MNKVLKIAVITAAILIAADLAAGFFLMQFAIGRKDQSVAEPLYEITEEARERIYRNTEELAAKTSVWLKTLDAEQVSVTAPDGAELWADCADRGGSKWVILLHGYSRTRAKVYNYGRFYAEHGYSLIMPDMRGHGSSGGNHVGMGVLDRRDVPCWVEFILSRRPDAQIVIHGVSMGAAAAMMTAGEELPSNVRAIVEDCGYTSVEDIFTDVMWDQGHVPAFPLLHTADMWARLCAGYGFGEVTSLDCVARTDIPILFIHGDSDGFVHSDMVYELYGACGSEKDLLIAKGASHGQAMYIDPDGYFDKVFEFVGRFVDSGDGEEDAG